MSRRKTKTHEENLARVRNNQRIHRKRVKEYIAELELQLKELREILVRKEEMITELNLQVAQAEEKVLQIAALKETRKCYDPSDVLAPIFQESMEAVTPTESEPTESIQEKKDTLSVDTASNLPPISHPANSSSCGAENKPPTSPEREDSCCPIKTTSLSASNPTTDSLSYTETLSLTNPNLPIPTPLESTTPCSKAYVLIDQQNFRGLDVDTIYALLAQGFRSGRKSGEGCRVENGMLLGVLDFISGV
jgi:hypothetical protein